MVQGGGVPRPRVPFYKKSIILKIQREDQDKMVRGYPDPREDFASLPIITFIICQKASQ